MNNVLFIVPMPITQTFNRPDKKLNSYNPIRIDNFVFYAKPFDAIDYIVSELYKVLMDGRSADMKLCLYNGETALYSQRIVMPWGINASRMRVTRDLEQGIKDEIREEMGLPPQRRIRGRLSAEERKERIAINAEIERRSQERLDTLPGIQEIGWERYLASIAFLDERSANGNNVSFMLDNDGLETHIATIGKIDHTDSKITILTAPIRSFFSNYLLNELLQDNHIHLPMSIMRAEIKRMLDVLNIDRAKATITKRNQELAEIGKEYDASALYKGVESRWRGMEYYYHELGIVDLIEDLQNENRWLSQLQNHEPIAWAIINNKQIDGLAARQWLHNVNTATLTSEIEQYKANSQIFELINIIGIDKFFLKVYGEQNKSDLLSDQNIARWIEIEKQLSQQPRETKKHTRSYSSETQQSTWQEKEDERRQNRRHSVNQFAAAAG